MHDGTVIARGGLKLRRSPKTGTIIKALRRNSKVEILERETWLRVRTRDGTEGYVLADFVETSPEDLFPSAASRASRAGTAPEPPADARSREKVDTTAPSAGCDIRFYRNTQFIGNELRADLDFFPCLDRLNRFAAGCGVQIFVTSSTREPERTVRGAIVEPASRSNHLVGHAIDMNVRSDGGLFNSRKLERDNLPNLPAEVRDFLDKVRDDPVLRWGGDFRREDPVHIDDALNKRDSARWNSKFASRK